MYQELVKNNIPVPWEMANNLMILHSYTLARLHIRLVGAREDGRQREIYIYIH